MLLPEKLTTPTVKATKKQMRTTGCDRDRRLKGMKQELSVSFSGRLVN
jgi:hypothetical protein